MVLQYPLALTTFILFLSLVWLLKVCKKSKVQKLPPGPWKLPLIGNLHNLIGSLPHHALRELARKYGPLMHLQLGEVSTLVVSSPRMASEFMKTHDLAFASRPLFLAAKIMTYGGSDIAFSPYCDYWRQMRKVCVLELLSAKRVQSFSSLREEEVHNLIESIHSSSGSPINFSEHIFTLTTTIICRAAFGNKCKDRDEFLSLVQEIISLAGGFELADLLPSQKVVHMFSRATIAKLEKIHLKLDKILENIIHDHTENQMMSASADQEDLVDVLLGLQKSGTLEYPITTNNIKGVILDIFAGGSDTSSTTVEWAMSEMMRNPRVLEKAQAEIRQVFKGKKKFHEKDLQNLSYLKLVIRETLRLHPPVSLLLPRECREPCSIDGYEIPIKTKVIINAWAIGRDPAYWHDVESFIPERFDNSSIDFKGTYFEYIPFGAGRRMCPGVLFGVANVEIPLAQLLYQFDWKLPGRLKPEDLDMIEVFGVVVKRKNYLHLIPTSFSPSHTH